MSDERLAFLRRTTEIRDQDQQGPPISCSFQHQAKGAEGEVELSYWPPRRAGGQAPGRLIVFILGNPGLLGYYPPFLNHLYSLLPEDHAILATSHIGHSTTIPPPPLALDLHQQLASKIELVQALRDYLDEWAGESSSSANLTPKICLMGHSVGAWLLCEVMKEVNSPSPGDQSDHREPVVEAGYLLFPTLGWIANTWNGWTLWPIFHRPVKSLLPLLSPLIRPILPYTTLPPTSLSLVRNPTVIEHVLHLSRSEMDLIREPDIEWFKSQNMQSDSEGVMGAQGQGLYGVWACGNLDGWVGKDGPLVQEALGGAKDGRVKVLDGVPHAFCLTQENSEIVAEAIASWINPASASALPVHDRSDSGPAGASVIPM
ncbi:hypothetical protein IAU59_006450 [Kwoniella sp. CBS 9459]